MRWIDEFRAFILRGNVIDLAVAVVIGAAFTAVVTALVADLITPLIAAIFGKPDFSGLNFKINGSVFQYGAFFNAVIWLPPQSWNCVPLPPSKPGATNAFNWKFLLMPSKRSHAIPNAKKFVGYMANLPA